MRGVWGQNDHLVTTNTAEGYNAGYALDGCFRIYSSDAQNRSPLFRCRTHGSGKHFVSNSGSCEGQIFEGLIGFTSTQQPNNTSVPQLFRCRHPQSGDYLLTSFGIECSANGYVQEGSLGWLH